MTPRGSQRTLPKTHSRVKVVRKKVVRLLHLSRPLAGGLVAPDESEELDQALIQKYMAVLRASPELEAIFRDMDSFIRQLRSVARQSPDTLARVQPSVQACVAQQWHRNVGALERSGCLEAAEGHTDERHQVLLAQVAESYLMEGVHDVIYPWLAAKHRDVDSRLSQVIELLRYHTQADVGIKAEFQCSQSGAVAALAGLAQQRTPMAKLLAFKEATQAIYASIQRHLEMHYRETMEDFQLATDDLVLAIVHAIIEAYPHSASLLTDLRYIKGFHFVSSSTSPIGFVLSNFEVALEWLVAKVGLQLMDDPNTVDSMGSARGLLVVDRPAPPVATPRASSEQIAGRQGADGPLEDEKKGWDDEDDSFMAQGTRNIQAIAPVATDEACRTNLASVLQDFGLTLADHPDPVENPPDVSAAADQRDEDQSVVTVTSAELSTGERTTSEGFLNPQRQVSFVEGDGDTPESGAISNTVMIFGDAAVRQSGDQAQTHSIVSDDDGLERPVHVRQVACGQQFFAAVTREGELQTWGLAEGGRLGHGQDLDVFFPLQKPNRVMSLHADRIVQVSCGAYHMMAVTSTGELYGWGDNRCSQLGLGPRPGPGEASLLFQPQQVFLPASHPADRRALCSRDKRHARARSANGGHPAQRRMEQRTVRVSQVSCGSLHSLALSEDGVVYSWGRAQSGRLGRVPESSQDADHGVPAPIHADWTYKVLDTQHPGSTLLSVPAAQPDESSPTGRVACIAAGWSHSLAVTEEGAVFAWGCGMHGRLGLGSHADVFFPEQVRALSSRPLAMVAAAAGYGHSLFLTATGAVFGCGYNKFGQVGVQAPSKLNPAQAVRKQVKVHSILTPKRVEALHGHRVAAISVGENHSVGISDDARVFTWGLNIGNQCAQGRNVEQQGTPKESELLRGARLVVCGAGHTMVVV